MVYGTEKGPVLIIGDRARPRDKSAVILCRFFISVCRLFFLLPFLLPSFFLSFFLLSSFPSLLFLPFLCFSCFFPILDYLKNRISHYRFFISLRLFLLFSFPISSCIASVFACFRGFHFFRHSVLLKGLFKHH